MGHYSDCYERDEEEARKRHIPVIENKTKEIEKLIEKYGLAGYLAREKVGY